jgi:hypothetical protein
LSKRTTAPISSRLAVLATALFAFGLICVPVALATTGAVGPDGGSSGETNGKTGKATLRDGKDGECAKVAVAPNNAPARIVAAIKAGNKICDKPYEWGGGHGKWEDNGYDCSGTVSYLLHAAGLLKRPLDSGGLARLIKKKKGKKRWKKGLGNWVTVAANGGHTYIIVAGLRMDTSGTGGKGPRWHSDGSLYRKSSYTILHPKRF